MKPYKLKLNDGGRNLSRRPYQINDCVVRALAIACRVKYDDVYDKLKRAGRKSHQGFDLDEWLGVSPVCTLQRTFTKVNKKGLTVNNFVSRHSKGTFLIMNHHHVWVVIDGVHHDMIRVKDQPLASIWRVR